LQAFWYVLRIQNMKQFRHHFKTFFMSLLLALLVVGSAAPLVLAAGPPTIATPAGLSISQLKITGDEFVVLTNNTANTISNLSSYWLYAFNNVNPLATGVSSSSEQLPTASLGAGQAILLSSNGMATCGAVVAGKLSISLGDSSGFLQLVQMGMSASGVTQNSVDSVSWSSGTTGIIASVPSNTKDPNALYYRYQTAGSSPTYGWQLADLDTATACKYNVTVGTTSTPVTTVNGLTGGIATPPVTIEELDDTGVSTTDGSTDASGGLPVSDIGLLAPVVNELLPNPASPQTDTSDEFIELYNPNDTAFDLTGFSLQVGSSGSAITHTYAFPSGTKLSGNSFVAYKSLVTKLSMSNTGGQVWLVDSFGNVVGQTAPYVSAKDGQVWALANGSWYWSTTPTPNAVNKMTAVVAKKAAAAPKTSTKTVTKAKTTTQKAKKAAATTKKKKATTKLAKTSSGTADVAAVAPRPIHNKVLVVVAMIAVLYGAYEYRHDIANTFHRLRTHRKNSVEPGEEVEGRRSHRASQ
jgi:hypothetical protein